MEMLGTLLSTGLIISVGYELQPSKYESNKRNTPDILHKISL